MLLSSEQPGSLSDERLSRRESWVQVIDGISDDVLSKVQYLQSQVGCPNVCAMCSQGASPAVQRVSEDSLFDLYAALKGSIQKRNGVSLGGSKDRHKPGIIFPYLDTDVASDPNLGHHCRILSKDFGCKVRLSTVGFSSKNPDLLAMHQRLASEDAESIDGLRLSITEYTKGFGTPEYLQDITTFLRTYRTLFETIGPGKHGFCMELRFKPFVRTGELLEDKSKIKAGPHLVEVDGDLDSLEVTNLTEIRGGSIRYTNEGLPAKLTTSGTEVKEGYIYKFTNQDGEYYAFSPGFSENKRFSAMHFYPTTNDRKTTGYNDAQRFFLNTLLSFKEQRPQQEWQWSDFKDFIVAMEQEIENYRTYYPEYAEHAEKHILPIARFVGEALQEADYPAKLFFERGFVFDTGQIVNQGRALKQFGGLINNEDDPSTPHELRGYGQGVSLSAQRGEVWRISPYQPQKGRVQSGYKNNGFGQLGINTPSWVFAPLDWRNLYPDAVRSHVLQGVDLVTIDRETAEKSFLLPGI